MTVTRVPLTFGLPEHLKDPEEYKRIEKKLYLIIHSDHQHKSVKAYVNCKRCTAKREKRQAALKELGFESTGQYLEWRKIMDIIINKRNV